MSRRRSVLVPFGTRPEVVKLAPVVRSLGAAGHDVRTLATGQHGDHRLAGEIFTELGLEPTVEDCLADQLRRCDACILDELPTLGEDLSHALDGAELAAVDSVPEGNEAALAAGKPPPISRRRTRIPRSWQRLINFTIARAGFGLPDVTRQSVYLVAAMPVAIVCSVMAERDRKSVV